MKRLVINADDFGFCESVNHGIIRAYREGVVSSTTIMANMPGFEHAVGLLKQNPDLPVGVHLNITCGEPLTEGKSLVNAEGKMRRENYLQWNLDDIYAELEAQIERVKAQGIQIDHLDSHHHIHTRLELRPVIEKLVEKYQLPIRGGFKYEADFEPRTESIVAFYKQGVSLENFEKILINLEDGVVYDMMSHPAYLERFIYDLSSYNIERMDELVLLTSSGIKELIQKYDVHVCDYKMFS